MTPEERATEKLKQWRSFLENNQTPEQKLMNFLTPVPAIPWHTLDMEVQGKKIYHLLPILQVKLSEKLSQVKSKKFVGRENEFDEKLEWYLTSIDTIKMHMPQPLASEKNTYVEYKTIVLGSELWNNHIISVDGTVLCRNEGYNWWSKKQMEDFANKVDAIIDGMMSDFALSEREAVEMVFLRKWWGLYGWQSSAGSFYDVGCSGSFVFSHVRYDGGVRCLYLYASNAWRDRRWQKSARTVARD